MTRVAADLERFLQHEPVEARPARTLRWISLWARRSPGAAIGACVALVLLLALIASLTNGYIRTSRALAATEREAVNTARALIAALTATPMDDESPAEGLSGKRLAKLKTALKTVEDLARRYPGNDEFPAAAERLRKAIEFTAYRGERVRGFHHPRE